MQGAFAGYATIGSLIVLGTLLAHLGVIDARGQRTFSMVAFYVASPALLLTVLQDTDVSRVFSGNLVAITGAILVSAAVYLLVARLRGKDLGSTVIGTLCSSYANAGNLGLPIAAYVLGDAALVAPVILLQMLVLQPLALTVLDQAISPNRLTLMAVLTRPLKNPITIGSGIGLLLSVTGTELPQPIHDPLELVGGMAVPSMLMAYGVSLRLGPLPGRGVPPAHLSLVVGLKLAVQPVAAYLLGRFALGLDAHDLLAVTVISALPTAQNVFVIATRYERAQLLARDAIFVSTLASVPVVLVITALLA